MLPLPVGGRCSICTHAATFPYLPTRVCPAPSRPAPPCPQAESYSALRDPASRHVALADQAGSGKTLAYLLPLLQALREQEAAAGGRAATVPGSPRVLVVTPTVGEGPH
jgi:hypothetical protein